MRAPELREVAMEASLALARLDADRLEALAASSAALNFDPGDLGISARNEMNRQVREASAEMAVFERVLEATRANLDVMNRLQERRRGRRTYPGRLAHGTAGPWVLAGKADGNH